ncbi:MAG: Uma2 family endonuclease [Ignavibacteriales bacterium]|nr:MAG: Uma2 family endonuclease [Ignavibacteriales bacterium]
MQANKNKLLSVEEYLEIERTSEGRNEYRNGKTYALAGATFKHNLICGNILAKLHSKLKNSSCKALHTDMKVYIKDYNTFVYPDISVVCNKPLFLDKTTDTLLNPVVIFEVLSKSTESYDRGMKFSFYRKLQSLNEYILVAQDRISVVHYTKSENDEWKLKEYNSLKDKFRINSAECILKLADIYNNIEFDEEPYALQLIKEAAAEYEERQFTREL